MLPNEKRDLDALSAGFGASAGVFVAVVAPNLKGSVGVDEPKTGADEDAPPAVAPKIDVGVAAVGVAAPLVEAAPKVNDGVLFGRANGDGAAAASALGDLEGSALDPKELGNPKPKVLPDDKPAAPGKTGDFEVSAGGEVTEVGGDLTSVVGEVTLAGGSADAGFSSFFPNEPPKAEL